MPYLLILRGSVRPLPALVAERAAYLRRLRDEGVFLMDGPVEDGDAAGVALAVGAWEDVERAADGDPYVKAGIAVYEILSFAPEHVREGLTGLVDVRPTALDGAFGWDGEALVRLRRRDLSVLGEGRPLRPVLQHVGQALLISGVAGHADLAERCARGLRDRGLPGDDVLDCELTVALGRPVEPDSFDWEWPLAPAPVDLSELAEALHGDPRHGPGALDPGSGMIVPPGLSDHLAELAEDDLVDRNSSLTIDPGSAEGFRDMRDFADSVTDAGLQARLLRALEARGSFRRFRDVLHDFPEQLTHWSLFSGERELGRARLWLAREGYRAVLPSR
ncbi:UPF0158 family protein [Spirillospora sp. NPDC052269]